MSDPADVAPETWRVTGGYHRDADGRTLGPGETFQPTNRQVASGSLRGKAERVKAHESIRSTGADIGLRSLKWGSEAALRKALREGLSEDDFQGREPSGATGYVTADVNAVLEERK